MSQRAPKTDGPRTTLRVPDALADVSERMAEELGISRNDALLRLATRGAALYSQELDIAQRRDHRWAAVMQMSEEGAGAQLPSLEEARAAVLAERYEDLTQPL